MFLYEDRLLCISLIYVPVGLELRVRSHSIDRKLFTAQNEAITAIMALAFLAENDV